MEHIKEVQLIILRRLKPYKAQPYVPFTTHYAGMNVDYSVILDDLIKQDYIRKSKVETGDGKYYYEIGISGSGILLIKQLTKEKAAEDAALGLNKRVSTWTIIAAIAGVIAAITGLYGIWLAYHTPH